MGAGVFAGREEVTYARGEPDGSWHLWTVTAARRRGGAAVNVGKMLEIYARYAPDGQEIYYSTWGPEPLSIGRVASERRTDASAGTECHDERFVCGYFAGWEMVGVCADGEQSVALICAFATDGTGEARRVGNVGGDGAEVVAGWEVDSVQSEIAGFDEECFWCMRTEAD